MIRFLHSPSGHCCIYFEKKGEIRMRTKAYGEELNADTLENVTGGGFVSKPQTLPERLGWNKWWLKRRPPYGD